MRLTQYTDYSLRVLIYLGLQTDGRLSTIHDIAGSYGISENHLMKVVHGLSRLGYVDAVRGRGGGLRLAREPQAISIGAVVRETEDGLVLVECFDAERNTCRITDACELHHVLDEARAAFFRVLDRYTLRDLLRPKAQLARLLQLTS